MPPSPKWVFTSLLFLWALGGVLGEALSQVALGAGMLIWARHRGRAPRLPLEAWVWAALLLAGWQALSPLWALSTGSASDWPRSGRYWQWTNSLGVIAAVAVARQGYHQRWLLQATAWAWIGNVAVGIYQHYFSWPFERFLFARTPVDPVREAFELNGKTRWAAGGLSFHRLRFSHGALAWLGPFLAVAKSRGLAVQTWGHWAAAVLISTAGYWAFARAGLLLSAGVWAWALRPAQGRGRALVPVLLAAGGLVALFGMGWEVRLWEGLQQLLAGERLTAMRAGWGLFTAHPWLGVGFGNHAPLALRTSSDPELTAYLATDSHNLWLTTAAETGLVGLALALAWFGLLGRELWRAAASGSPVARGALWSFWAFQGISLVHYVPYHTGVFLGFCLVWGLGAAEHRAPPAEQDSAPYAR